MRDQEVLDTIYEADEDDAIDCLFEHVDNLLSCGLWEACDEFI